MSCFSDTQAKELWKARWRRIPLKALVAKYQADPRRFYEVWMEEENPGTRLAAFAEISEEDPEFASHIDPAPHKPHLRVVSKVDDQPNLFS